MKLTSIEWFSIWLNILTDGFVCDNMMVDGHDRIAIHHTRIGKMNVSDTMISPRSNGSPCS